MLEKGSWIFLSHSSKDIEQVRWIRNELEQLGQNPIAFHLKCLSTETPEQKEELLNLLKREIDARDWFIYCDSKNAEQSEYVQLEREYILSTAKDKIWNLKLNRSPEMIKQQLTQICMDITVFLSYSLKDRKAIFPLLRALKQADFNLWQPDENLDPGDIWGSSIRDAIQNVSKRNGYFIYILSKHTSKFSLEELKSAIDYHARIIPISIGDVDFSNWPTDLKQLIQEYPFIELSEQPTDAEIAMVMSVLNGYLLENIHTTNTSFQEDQESNPHDES